MYNNFFFVYLHKCGVEVMFAMVISPPKTASMCPLNSYPLRWPEQDLSKSFLQGIHRILLYIPVS